MAWADYWRSQIDGIEDVERHADHSWAAVLALILLLESGLRRSLARRAAALPANRAGLIDFSTPAARRAVRRFRAGAGHDIRRWIRQASVGVAGRAVAPLAGPVAVARESVAAGAVRRSMAIFGDQWARGQRIVAKDEARAAEQSQTSAGGAGVQMDTTRSAVPPAGENGASDASDPGGRETLLPPQPRARDREAIDFEELARDQLFNLLRAFADEGLRLEETIGRVSGRFSRPGDVLDHLLGSGGDRRRTRAPAAGGEEGWHLDRNRLRLSFAAHVRGAHRRRTVSEGSAAGHHAFRLDVPASRLGHVAPDGQLGPHLWRVRTLGEWTEVQASANAGRIRSSSWDTLGLGFGDVSYIVAVPAIYLAAARASGEDLRRKWLEA